MFFYSEQVAIMIPKLDEIIIYPIKSFRGFSCQYAKIEDTGLRWDRQYIVTDCSGKLTTTGTEPHFLRFEIQLIHGNINIITPDGQTLMFSTNDFSNQPEYAEIGGNYFHSYIASIKINRWFSDYLKKDVQLRKLGEKAMRRICRFPSLPLSFTDNCPIILINQSSFEYIEKHNTHRSIRSQIRSNLIIKGFPAFDESCWKTLQIGNIQFDVITLHPRFIPTNSHPETALTNELLQSSLQFKSFCKDFQQEKDLGIYLIPRNYGTITIGDEVQILEFKTSASYSTESIQHKNIPASIALRSEENIDIEYQYLRFRGNSQQTLLEQLEQHHINLPYSCRAGICGRCEVELISGEVTPLTQSAIKTNKKILACSCRPKNTLKIR